MQKPPESVLSRNSGQRLDNRLLEGLARASAYPSQNHL
jgi:hypothetical protein